MQEINPEPLRCVKCGGIVDAKGVNGQDHDVYCACVCRWPDGGCGVRIYFIVNARENRQPFTLADSRPHHISCVAYLEKTRRERLAAKHVHEPDARPPGVPRLESFYK